jgi:hypothetical protein
MNENKFIKGGKKKNGHKSNCSCHICDNMLKKAQRGGYEEEIQKQILKKMGGSKKKNGHKPDCSCPICKNMKHASKKGGTIDLKELKELKDIKDDTNLEIPASDNEYDELTGGRRHRTNKRTRQTKSRRTRRRRRRI